MTVAALDLGSGADLRFFLEFTEADGTRRRDPLASCVTARLENVLPVRSFQWAKGASHFPGLWWSSTTGDHVGLRVVAGTRPYPNNTESNVIGTNCGQS